MKSSTNRLPDYEFPGPCRTLTREQEAELGRRSKAGDIDARDELIERNIGLAVGGATRYQGWTALDQMQAGVMGLFTAAERFDPDRFPGVKFATFATWHVRKAQQDGRFQLCSLSITRYGASDRAGRSEAIAEQAHRAFEGVVSLHELLEDVPDGNLADTRSRPPGEEVERNNTAEYVRSLLDRIDRRQAEVIRRRVGIGGPEESLAEIAASMGLTKERVRQIERRGLERLARLAGSKMTPYSLSGRVNRRRDA